MIGEDGEDNGKPKPSVMMRENSMKTLRGAIEMSRLISSNTYDEKVQIFKTILPKKREPQAKNIRKDYTIY